MSKNEEILYSKYTVQFEPNQELPEVTSRTIFNSIALTFPPESTFPPGVLCRKIYRSYPHCVYPWWAPLWLRRRLPYWLRLQVPYSIETAYDLLGIIGERES